MPQGVRRIRHPHGFRGEHGVGAGSERYEVHQRRHHPRRGHIGRPVDARGDLHALRIQISIHLLHPRKSRTLVQTTRPAEGGRIRGGQGDHPGLHGQARARATAVRDVWGGHAAAAPRRRGSENMGRARRRMVPLVLRHGTRHHRAARAPAAPGHERLQAVRVAGRVGPEGRERGGGYGRGQRHSAGMERLHGPAAVAGSVRG